MKRRSLANFLWHIQFWGLIVLFLCPFIIGGTVAFRRTGSVFMAFVGMFLGWLVFLVVLAITGAVGAAGIKVVQFWNPNFDPGRTRYVPYGGNTSEYVLVNGRYVRPGTNQIPGMG